MRFASIGVVAACAGVLAACSQGSNPTDSGTTADSGNGGQDSGMSTDSGSGNDAGGNTDSGFDAGPTTDVTATVIVHHLTDTTPVDVPTNLSAATIAVYVPDPNAAGGYDVYPGSGVDAGLLDVPGVPVAALSAFYLKLNGSYVEGTTAALDLSTYVAGRPGDPRADAGTTVAYNVTGLTPWVAGYTQIVLTSAGADVDDNLIAVAPDAGAVTATGSFDYATLTEIQAAKGDVAVVFEYQATTVDAGLVATAALASALATGFSTVGGAANLLDAGLTALPQLPASWIFDGTGFSALGSDVNPAAMGTSQVAGVQGVAGGTAYGPLGLRSTVLDISQVVTQTTPFAVGATFGNPFPASWGLMGFAQESFAVPYTLALADGGTRVVMRTGTVTIDDALSTFVPADGGTLTPVVGPATSVLQDGMDWTVDQILLSDTPIVSWSAPSLGTPSHYLFSISQLAISPAGAVTATTVADIYTTQQSVQVFPGILVSGQTYYFLVRSIYAPNGAFATAPLQLSFPWDTADALSGLMTAP
jgi:hypothetical protein